MIKKVFVKLKSEGIGGLLEIVYRRIRPHRLGFFSHCKPFLQSGTGLEIGGPSDIFGQRGLIPVYPIAARIDNCNFDSHTVWEGAISAGDTFIFDKKKAPGRQYVAEASYLPFIESSSYDFVITSHCIEHMANPLQGLAEWIRLLKNDGLLVLVTPHKDGTFDHRRPITSLEHLIDDFNNHTGECDMTHLEEILKLHDLTKDPGAEDFQFFQERSKRNIENRCLHQHVFDTRLAVEVINYMRLQILTVELFLPLHIIIVAKKLGHDQSANNQRFREVDASWCWHSPFPSDRPIHH